MKKREFLKVIAIMTMCLIAVGSFSVFSEPGGTDDPVVSKSYIVDKVVPELKAYVDERLGLASADGTVDSRPDSYIVVSMSPGQKLIGEAGTELILRMGKGKIIATQKGGLADTTIGYDLADGLDMPSNHLLIVPVADGRGFEALTDVLVMVRGGYSIKK